MTTSCSNDRSNPRRTVITAPPISTTTLSATGAFAGRRTTSAILIFRSGFARDPPSRRLPFPLASVRNCDAAHVNVPLVNGLPSANSVADCPLRPHSSIRSAQTASVFGFIPAKMLTIHALVKNGVCAPDTRLDIANAARKVRIPPSPQMPPHCSSVSGAGTLLRYSAARTSATAAGRSRSTSSASMRTTR